MHFTKHGGSGLEVLEQVLAQFVFYGGALVA
jgi:hypothetical protein